MAVTTTVLAYFFDMLPHIVDNVTGIASSNNASISSNEAAAQDN